MDEQLAPVVGAIGFGTVLVLVVLDSFGIVTLPEQYIRTIIYASIILMGSDDAIKALSGGIVVQREKRNGKRQQQDDREGQDD